MKKGTEEDGQIKRYRERGAGVNWALERDAGQSKWFVYQENLQNNTHIRRDIYQGEMGEAMVCHFDKLKQYLLPYTWPSRDKVNDHKCC